MPRGPKRLRSVCVGAVFLLYSAPISASVAEHWSCAESKYTQEWTITDDRMFAPKGKGYLPVIMNTPQVAVAYLTASVPGHVMIHVLDKIAGKMVIYDNLAAAVANGDYGKVAPDISTATCRRID
jgi:hypothetical protein